MHLLEPSIVLPQKTVNITLTILVLHYLLRLHLGCLSLLTDFSNNDVKINNSFFSFELLLLN